MKIPVKPPATRTDVKDVMCKIHDLMVGLDWCRSGIMEERLRHISAYSLELADKLKGERMSKKRDWTYSGHRRTWPKGSK